MDGQHFCKAKPGELRAELEAARRKLKPQARVAAVLKKILANGIMARPDTALLVGDVVPLMAIDDYPIRRLCCHIITQHALDDDPRAVAFFARFVRDPDPLLRALAIRTVLAVALPNYTALAVAAAPGLLADANPHVRTAAAFAVARLYAHSPGPAKAAGLVACLNELLYDGNTTVVANALAALHDVTELVHELELDINKAHLLALMHAAGSANAWRQLYLLDAVVNYVPATHADAVQLLDAVVPLLLHENAAVAMCAVKVAVYLCNYIRDPEHTVPGLARRVGATLVALLTKQPEIQFLVLRNVILLLLASRHLVAVDVEAFFWLFDDPPYIKDTKLEIIYVLAADTNLAAVFRELHVYATEVDAKMARKAVRALGNLALKSPLAAAACVDVLLDLDASPPHVLQEIAVVAKNVLRKYPDHVPTLLPGIAARYAEIDDPDAKIALAWMLSQYAEDVPAAQPVLEHLARTFQDEALDVQLALVTLAVKFYLKFPERGEKTMLRVLKAATEESDNPDLRERGFFYWRLLAHPRNAQPDPVFQRWAARIVLVDNPDITLDPESINPDIVEELELNFGTLASIYLKSVRHVFRFAKHKQLKPSPALQERRVPASQVNLEAAPDKTYAKPLPPISRETQGFIVPKKQSLALKLSRKASLLRHKSIKY